MRPAALIAGLLLVAPAAAEAVPAPPDASRAPHVAAASTAPAGLAAELVEATALQDAAIDAWLADGARGRTPRAVVAPANRRQRVIRHLGTRRTGLRRVLRRLPASLRPAVRDEVRALRELRSIHSVVVQRPRIRIGRPQTARRLRRHYRRAWRRFGVGWPLLAAVNFVETRFGRLRNQSVSGARGPMQFMPATWAAYGLGGNVRAPRDAILGAANYLHASGAPGDERRALYRYNPSRAYVRAVSRYVRRMRADERAYYAYHAWNVRHLR